MNWPSFLCGLMLGTLLVPLSVEAEDAGNVRGGAVLRWPQDWGEQARGYKQPLLNLPLISALQRGCGLDVPDGYRVRTGDVLLIAVRKNEATIRRVPVRPDGKISLPLLNHVEAAGLTALELSEILARKLAVYMPSPEVAVLVCAGR